MPLTKVSKNNQILKEIINNSWNGIGIIDPSSKFVYVNDAFKPILGFDKSELLQMRFETLLSQKDRVNFKELIIKNFDNEYTNSIRVECLRKDKKIVYLDISIKLMSNKQHIVINANDITGSISDHEIFDKYVIQAHVNKEGIITKVSEAFCRLCLFSEFELIGKPYTHIYNALLNDNDLDTKIQNDILNNAQYNGVVAAVNKYGDTFWVDIIIKPINNKYGDVIGYSAVMFDMTNEVSLQKNTEELEETIIDNEVKLTIMGDTLRTVAHEWRQPLNNISLEAQDLLFSYTYSDDEVKKEEAIPILRSMQGNIEGLSQIISKFQSITELRSSKVNSNIVDIIKHSVSKSSIKEKFLSGDYSKKVLFNTYPSELETAIVTIFNNAYDAISKMDEDIESIIILNTYVSADDKNLVLEISNNGGNIESNILNQIFDAYFSTKEEKNGVGLNLYISKVIIELHLNGKIEVLNKKNNIVTFTITLPIGI
jgi:PAS domain S-box-containing protein